MTLSCSRRLSLLVLFLAAMSGARASDLKVVSVVRFQNGDTDTSVRYYQGERTRVESRDRRSWKPGVVTYGPRRATIFQCDAQRVVELNLEAHKYAVFELNDDCRGRSAPPLPAPQGTTSVYLESTDTGERSQILGHTARHIVTHQRQVAGPGACWGNHEMDLDGWYIDIPEQPVDQKHRRSAVDGTAHVIMSGANCRDKIEVHHQGIEKPGFPVKLVQTSRSLLPQPDGTSKEYTSRWESEVTELSDAPLDAALFDLPTGFSKVAKIDARPEVPASVAVEYWWHRVVHEVGSWF